MRKSIIVAAAVFLVFAAVLSGGFAVMKASSAGSASYFDGKRQDIIWSMAKADMTYADDVAARMTVPRLNKSMLVLSSSSGLNHGNYPFWISGTDFPGAEGISLVSGSNDGAFSFLRLIEEGDVITLETTDGRTVRYTVSSLSVTEEDEVRVADAEERKNLMLVTHYEFSNWQAGQGMRLVVIAREAMENV